MSNQSIIITLDGRPPAILDKDLAIKFEVATKRINEARNRNPKRFPSDFAFQLTDLEVENLRSQNRTRNSSFWNMLRSNPWAYTENGMITMSGCLNSDAAAEMSVYLARKF
ncbi:MAG: ORF6N domain-containing protein, partial [Ghiorsea sp.]|nr:ORF6N domain-containing protein [Ghiorsea sp.]